MLDILHDTETDNGRHNLYSFNQASWTRSNIESLLPNPELLELLSISYPLNGHVFLFVSALFAYVIYYTYWRNITITIMCLGSYLHMLNGKVY